MQRLKAKRLCRFTVFRSWLSKQLGKKNKVSKKLKEVQWRFSPSSLDGENQMFH